MDSPADGDELARVVPLRRRDRELTAAPGARGTLPRERAPFDPEIEPYETPSGNSRPQGMALHAAHAALRRRRIPGPHDGRRADTPRRHSTVMLLTGIAGAGLATVAALLLLVDPQPVHAFAPGRVRRRSRDCGRARAHHTRCALGQRQPIRRERQRRHPEDPTGGRAPRPSRTSEAGPDSVDPHPLGSSDAGNAEPSVRGRRLVHAGSSASSGGDAAPDTRSLAITNSTPAPVSASTPEQSTSPSQPRASSASSTNRPAFGEQGLLGPGSSPDS